MNIDLSPEAVEYGHTARRALEAAGGDELAQFGAGGGDGADGAAKVLAELGAWDLDPRGSGEELEAAAALCRSAGWWAVPHPVAERLARPHDVDADALAVVAGDGSAASVAAAISGVALRWVAVDLGGRRSLATPQPGTVSGREARRRGAARPGAARRRRRR